MSAQVQLSISAPTGTAPPCDLPHACCSFVVAAPLDVLHVPQACSAVQVQKGHLNSLRDVKAALNKQLALVSSLRQVGLTACHCPGQACRSGAVATSSAHQATLEMTSHADPALAFGGSKLTSTSVVIHMPGALLQQGITPP